MNLTYLYHGRSDTSCGYRSRLSTRSRSSRKTSEKEIQNHQVSLNGSGGIETKLRYSSVWRPIGAPVESNPLAFMDGSTVPDDKLVVVDVVRRSFPGESYYPLEDGEYRWHFMNRQTENELLFMKMNDSKKDVKAKCK